MRRVIPMGVMKIMRQWSEGPPRPCRGILQHCEASGPDATQLWRATPQGTGGAFSSALILDAVCITPIVVAARRLYLFTSETCAYDPGHHV